MKETIEMNENVEETEIIEAAEPVKPYKFRRLSADDMFLMFRIIGKIGIKELKACFSGDTVKALMQANGGNVGSTLETIGFNIFVDAVDIILGNIHKCKAEIYQLLAAVSDLPEEKIKADALLFTEMVIDFFKKEEFPAFIGVVSKSFR